MTKEDNKQKVFPVPLIAQPPFPSTSFAPPFPLPTAPPPILFRHPPPGFHPPPPNLIPEGLPTGCPFQSPPPPALIPEGPPSGCPFQSPPPPYPCSTSSCSSDTYYSPKDAPPLPPRERIVIGRHAARFDIKEKHLRDPQNDTMERRKKFINPIVSGKRRCTDCPCCLLFTFFMFGWIFVAFLGFTWGKPERLLHPTDSEGRMCGTERAGYYDLRLRPYLLYFDITKCASYSVVFAGCQTPQICVDRCPSSTFTYLQLQSKNKAEFLGKVNRNIVCKDSVIKEKIGDFAALKTLVNSGQCTAYTVASAAVLGRCIPDVVLNLGRTIQQVQSANSTLNNLLTNLEFFDDSIPEQKAVTSASQLVGALVHQKSIIEKIAADLEVTWWQIMSMLAITAVISFLWTVVMRLLGSFLIWTAILFVVVVLSGGSAYCWLRFKALHEAGAINDYSFQPNIDVYFEMPTTWMAIAIFLSVFAAITLITLFIVRSRITLAVALIQESSKAVGAIMSSLFLPVVLLLLHFAIFFLWGALSVWIASSGEENCQKPITEGGDLTNSTKCDCSVLGTGQDPSCQYVNITRNENLVFAMQLYNLFAFLWSSWFLTAICDVTLAGAFASYYWAFNKHKDVPPFPILLALRRALRYHLGTIAFGSLIITTVKVFRIILDFVDKKLSTTHNAVIKFVLKCVKCLFWCVDAVLKFLTKNAYIMTAIYGKSFCWAARDSFDLIWKNALRYAVLDKVTDFLLFLGKASITLGMGVVAFHWFTGRWVIEGLPHIDLYYYFVPVIITVIGAYFIADLFFDVYEMAVKTTFLCFLEDAQNNDGTPDKPYYMSKDLQRIMGKENQFRFARADK